MLSLDFLDEVPSVSYKADIGSVTARQEAVYNMKIKLDCQV
jgi:hypothetical protein